MLRFSESGAGDFPRRCSSRDGFTQPRIRDRVRYAEFERNAEQQETDTSMYCRMPCVFRGTEAEDLLYRDVAPFGDGSNRVGNYISFARLPRVVCFSMAGRHTHYPSL